jgi:hypothetical protein
MIESDLRFHHIGIAVDSLIHAQQLFINLGFKVTSGVFYDDIQGVNLIFMKNRDFQIELVENATTSNKISPWLKSTKIQPYHFAYLVTNLSEVVSEFVNIGYKLINPPVKAKAFDDRLIAFLISKELFMIELIEESREV